MFKRVLLAASAMLLSVCLMAQTVDFTGITVNTERVTKKKVYERKSFVLVDGAFLIGHGKTGLVGARYGMVWRLGFYAGAEIGIHGFPSFKGGDRSAVTVEQRSPAFAFNAGLIIRLSRVVNLYLGPGILQYAEQGKTESGNWVDITRFKPGFGGELGVFLHFGRVTVMPGISIAHVEAGSWYGPDQPKFTLASFKLGVGFNF